MCNDIDRMSYIWGGIYRYPCGNMCHFISSSEAISTDLDGRKYPILARNVNINLVKYYIGNIVSYMPSIYDAIMVFSLYNAA